MSLEKERIAKIKEILLQHKGQAKAISARDIALKVDIPDNDTFGGTRGLITKLMEEEDLPIGASHDGFYLICNKDELRQYVLDLSERAGSILNRKVLVMVNYRRFYNQSVELGADDSNDGDDGQARLA